MTKTIENFCGQGNGYSRSITLRNKLIPIGKTADNLKQFLEKDQERADVYPEIKKLIDEIHRGFIEDTLTNFSFVWEPLFGDFELYQNEKDKTKKATKKKDLEKFQSGARKKIVEAFKKHPDYDKLFKDGLFKELLPALIENSSDTEISNKEEALKVFDRFSTYFVGFHENRKNMYSEEEKSTAISYRIVNENFPKFYANVKLYNYIKENFPQIISETEESLKNHLNGKKLDEIFNVESFNDVLAQSGIDFYNTVIGGISTETEKVQGLNEKINLARQQVISQISFLKNQNASENTEKIKELEKKANELKKKMVVLFKQILSDRGTSSFIPVGFNNNDEVYSSIKSFNDEFVNLSICETKELFKQVAEFNLSEIYVPAKSLTNFSQNIFGSWSILTEGLFLLEKDKVKKALSENQEEKINKEISKKDYSFDELQVAYERYCNEHNFSVEKNCKDYFDVVDYRTENEKSDKKKVSILSAITESYSKIDFENIHDLQQEKEAATPIKTYLDEVQNLYHHLKLVDYRGEEQKDSNFYSKLDEILTELSEIVPLYNKVRNFVTKKPGEVKKIRLKFDSPTCANGWAFYNELMYGSILLREKEKYYLGIMNKNFHKEFKSYPKPKENENYYEKMVYLQAADPSKDIPNLLKINGKTVKKNGRKDSDGVNRQIEEYRNTYLPKEINEIRKRKSYLRTSDSFSKDDLIKYIDYYKILTKEYFDAYDFKFKDTKEYYSFLDFTDDVNSQAYQIQFVNVSKEYIDTLVNDGKLFLFQIYNKDFAEKKSGKKNLHTLYWETLFSEENLKNVCLTLDSGQKLFWRKASLDKEKVTVHKKGSILVNRTTSDGKSIPEDIYQEIYQFKNKMIDNLSDNAKSLLDSGVVVCKEATHDITKDNRFTEDTYLFHCPITMNFKAPDKSNKEFNNHVLEVLSGNPDVKIIGLDRGERHLIYLSLINQKGEIELQKTLNLVDQVRNDKTVKVNYQEKLVHKEGDRDKARKNWQTIGNIKELKEGYLSNVVHEIAKMMVEHNAIVVMEDLNFGFKRGRFAVERQIYQKFENMLIEKLNYLVFKDKKVTEPGGVLNAYQLTNKSANVSDVYRQCGWLFYIPAAYTSKIDPKTGFANLFITKGLTNVEKKKEFFDKFDTIRYDSKEDCFVFGFDYGKICDNADFKKKWEVYTKGERLVYNNTERKNISINPTEELKSIFDDFGINWNNNEENFIDSVHTIQAEKSNAKFFDTLLRMFNATLQMRNSIPNTEIDYLISPVKSEDGTFFDSREELKKGENAKLPIDADANGAYHIALKGLYLLENDFNRNDKGVIQNISNADWFKFVQEKNYEK